MNGKIIDLPYLSLNFPKLSPCPIDRSNYLDTIERMFSNENKIVFINGDSGVGKTYLLADFCRRNNENAVSIFSNTRDKYSYERRNVEYDMSNQISWILFRTEIKEESYDPSYLRRINITIRKHLRKSNQPIYIVFDGLESIPAANLTYLNDLLADLPHATNNIFFLFGGSEKYLKPLLSNLKYLTSTELFIPSFSLDETRVYLNLISNDSHSFANDIYRMTKGFASKLDSIRNSINRGLTFEDIINGGDGKDVFLELEWKQVDYQDSMLCKLLAFLAFGEIKFDIKMLSEFTDISETTIVEKTSNVSFITISENAPLKIEYCHDSYKNYARKILSSYEKEVIGNLVEYYSLDSNSYESISHLSNLYERMKKWGDILSLLTPTKINILLEKSESISSIIQQTEKGINASKNNDDVESSYKFNLYKSVLLEIERLDVWKSEIEAKISLGEYDNALFLAQTAFLKEDRLKLLSLIVRKMKECGETIDSTIIDNVRELYDQIEFSQLKEGVIEIATNLMYSCPDLAIKLIENTGQVLGENMMDWALAQLSLSTIKSGIDEDIDDINEAINSRIKNNEIKNLVKGIRFFGGSAVQSDVLSVIKIFDKASEKLFFIRNWIRNDSSKKNIGKVLEEAYNIIISASEYVVNASVMKDLAYGIRFIEDPVVLNSIISKYYMLKETIKQRGPTKDYIQFNLNIITAEININYDKALNDIYEIFYFIDDLKDIVIKADCLVIYLRKIIGLQKIHSEIVNEKLIDEPKKLLLDNVNIMIDTCAFHSDIFKYVLQTLPKINDEYVLMACDIADRLNVLRRRDLSYCEIVSAYLLNQIQTIDKNNLYDIYKKISHVDNKKAIIVEVWEKLSDNDPCIVSENISKLFYDEIGGINDSIVKCYCYVRAYIYNKKNKDIDQEFIKSLKTHLYDSWTAIDSAWDKIEVAFKIATDLAKCDKGFSKEYLELGVSEKKHTFLDSPNRAHLLIHSIKLAIRTFSSLPLQLIEDENIYKKISDLINNLPSVRAKLELWGELALRLINNKHHNIGYKIAREEIRSAIPLFVHLDNNSKNEIMLRIAPSLFQTHQNTALEDIIKYVEKDHREQVYFEIIDYLITKKQYDDSCDKNFYDRNISYEEFSDCLNLLELITLDNILYPTIKRLVDIIVIEKNRFSSEQIKDIKRRLNTIISKKLPDKLNILHDGYNIVARAQLLRIDREKYNLWQPLFAEATSIPNISDRSLVLSIVLEALTTIRKTDLDMEKKEWVSKILKYIEQIPSFYERMQRITEFLPTLRVIDKENCINNLKALFSLISVNYDQNSLNQQKELIDFAFSISPELAESLIAKYDDDPSRIRVGSKLNNHLNYLNMEKNIFEMTNPQNGSEENLPMLCGSLVQAIHSNKLNSRPLKELDGFVSKISQMRFSESYPISVYVLENSIFRYRTTNEASTILLRIFESIIFSCEMICYLGRRSASNRPEQINQFIPLHNIIIKKGQEDKAKAYLREWGMSIEINEVIIIDPYFSENDLSLIKEFQEINTNINYIILTGIAHNKRIIENRQYEDAFADAWQRLSIEKAPNIKFVIVGRETNSEPPFHDRWWLVNRGERGLRVGTSFNSLGKNKDSELSILTEEDSRTIFQSIVLPYAENNVREYKSERLNYRIFMI